MNGKQRLNEILEHLGMSANHLAIEIGVSSQTFYDILNKNRKNTLSKRLALKIVNVYPQFDLQYLLTGQGELIMTEKDKERIEKIEEAIMNISQSVLNNSEAKIEDAKARTIDAEAFNRLTKNMEKLIELLEYKIKN